MAQSHLRQKTSLQTAAALLLAVLTMLLATACGAAPQESTPTPSPNPRPKTEQITYPAQFIHAFGYDDGMRGSRKAAKDFKDSGDFTNAYAMKNGDVIVIATEKQRQNRIKEYDTKIAEGEKEFQQGSPDYRYQINSGGTAMTIWADRHLTPTSDSGISFTTPLYYGYNYYMKGNTGPWDMTITVRNCHTDQFIHQYQLSQGWKHGMDELGE
ncbi:hypothetical protein OZX67_00805 [Bifidobacterium sp. ESL0728]|uniref:hypothetical protein n=1 Tax=Bifidobacterium sp. ESL0728 TaxID=2983220 RepID=UPI0023F87555|nr:hypothetical protein [Bifidobacterium sp. ESL0728]WEV59147.1 hypothetical protein OZX67_00805 [Bifidobacterium sp. ESL0728]